MAAVILDLTCVDLNVYLALAQRARIGIPPDPIALIGRRANLNTFNANVIGINRSRIDAHAGIIEPFHLDVAAIDICDASNSRIMQMGIWAHNVDRKELADPVGPFI